MRRLISPRTITGQIRLFSLILYLSSSTAILGKKPSTAVSRTLQTQNFPVDVKTTLKASINALQDLDYTIDVLNSDVGLITASRTTEQKAQVTTRETETGPAIRPIKTKAEFDAEQAAKEEQRTACLKWIGVAVVAVFAYFTGAIFGDKDDDDDDDNDDDVSVSSGKSRSSDGMEVAAQQLIKL